MHVFNHKTHFAVAKMMQHKTVPASCVGGLLQSKGQQLPQALSKGRCLVLNTAQVCGFVPKLGSCPAEPRRKNRDCGMENLSWTWRRQGGTPDVGSVYVGLPDCNWDLHPLSSPNDFGKQDSGFTLKQVEKGCGRRIQWRNAAAFSSLMLRLFKLIIRIITSGSSGKGRADCSTIDLYYMKAELWIPAVILSST